MKPGLLFVLWICISAFHCSNAQEWQLFTGSDAVTDFKLFRDQVWVISGSGLTRIDVNSGEQTNWNLINSDIRDYSFDAMAIDSTGGIWLGGFINKQLVRFDGSVWQHYTSINGFDIGTIYDIQVTPDGKVWLLGHFSGQTLFYFENNQFHEVPPPTTELKYRTGTDATLGIGLDNHVWFSFHDQDDTIFRLGEFDGSQWTLHNLSAYTNYLSPSDKWIGDRNGNLYMLPATGPGNQILKYDGTNWQSISMPASINDYLNQDRPLYLDDQNRIWLAIENNTFLRFDGLQWETIGLNTLGLTGGSADGLFIDHNQKYWIYYSKDTWNLNENYLCVSDGHSATQIDLSNSPLLTNSLRNVYIDPQNNKWINSDVTMIKYNGNTWKNTTLDYVPAAIGHDGNGGVWLSSYYESHLFLLDNWKFSKIPITKPGGIPYDNIYEMAVDKNGIVYVASRDSFILVFDHGITSYLGGMKFILFGQLMETDFSAFTATDTSGRLFSLGYNSIHRLEDNNTWTNIPLWEENPISIHSFTIAPNGDIWMPYGLPLPNQGTDFKIYHNGTWSNLVEPYEFYSLPHWDREGNLWMVTDEGLCKKVNSDWTCYNETNSPLPNIGLPYVRIRDFEIDNYDNIWIILEDGGLMLFNENKINHIEGYELPFISGNIYRDLNQNTVLDDNDTPMALQRVRLLPDSTITFSNPDGLYRFSGSPGDHIAQYIPSNNWHIDNSPEEYGFQLGTDSISGFDFRIAPDQEKVDLRFFLSEGYPRCHNEAGYSLSYSNYGTQSESGRVYFVLDPQATFYSSYPNPTLISGDTVFWIFTNLLPTTINQVYMVLGLPGGENDTLTFKSYLDRLINGQYHHLDSIITEQEIRCSFDPNDKIGKSLTTREDGSGSLFEPIRYTIRFQNTGNDTAFNVIILDTLDANLDPTTFTFLGASHPCDILIRQERIVEFRFLDILLPDSTVNELNSHGFISYSIKPKINLPSPVTIENRASIHFDFNDAILTNTVSNKLVDPTLATKTPLIHSSFIHLFPNPADEEIIVEPVPGLATELFYTIIDGLGTEFFSGRINPGEQKHINILSLPSGVYGIKVNNGLSSSTTRFVKH